MRTREEQLSLTNIADGAVIERFDQALKDILENLMDPNTTDKKREIVVKVSFKRNADRTMIQVDAAVDTKPASRNPVQVVALMGKALGGGVEANEVLPAQQPLFSDNVTPMRKEGE